MCIARILKHLTTTKGHVSALFSEADLQEIQQAITASEKQHNGEVVFFVEKSLPLSKLRQNLTSRERALEIFSQMRVWDTAQNKGVMIYLLVADRKFEIIADRGLDQVVKSAGWEQIKTNLEENFRQRNFKEGILQALTVITRHLSQAFPYVAGDKNELSDDVKFV
ncbi:MAG: TPM domain-containing protein [Deltaproteobacteria bacterium]|nr:TPM domain-containing protein [Deltaproteobacteria bacterium]